MPGGLDGQPLLSTGRNGHVQVHRVGRDLIDRTLLAPEASTHDADLGTVVVLHNRDFIRLDPLVPRRCHFERGRKVRPQLESMHAAGMIASRHLLMDDSAARRHPLYVAGSNAPAMAHAVAVFRSEEHTSELQSRVDLVCRLLLEKKKQ